MCAHPACRVGDGQYSVSAVEPQVPPCSFQGVQPCLCNMSGGESKKVGPSSLLVDRLNSGQNVLDAAAWVRLQARDQHVLTLIVHLSGLQDRVRGQRCSLILDSIACPFCLLG